MKEQEVKMDGTALNISPAAMTVYRATARKYQKVERRTLAQRKNRAWKVARQAAELLKTQFGATRVVIFGSLIHRNCFTPWSDVDIAAWGISSKNTFQAIGAVLALDSAIETNLVDINSCQPSLLEVIEREGVTL